MLVGLHCTTLFHDIGLAQGCWLRLETSLVKSSGGLRSGADPLLIRDDGIEVRGRMRQVLGACSDLRVALGLQVVEVVGGAANEVTVWLLWALVEVAAPSFMRSSLILRLLWQAQAAPYLRSHDGGRCSSAEPAELRPRGA